jgi:hypothetical protein
MKFPVFHWGKSEAIAIEWKDSTIFYSGKYISSDDSSLVTFTDKIAELEYFEDSILVNFHLNRINDSTYTKSGFYYNYMHVFNKPLLTFYNFNEGKRKKGNYFLKYFKTFPFEIDSAGNIYITTSHIVKLNDSTFLDGIYKGHIPEGNFIRFKQFLADSLIKKHLLFHQPYRQNRHGGCIFYSLETKNLYRRRSLCTNNPNEYPINLESWLYDDNSWINNKMKFYGYDPTNINPL